MPTPNSSLLKKRERQVCGSIFDHTLVAGDIARFLFGGSTQFSVVQS